MKIYEPCRFFAGNIADPGYSENYRNALLMARGDVICQYSKENIPGENSWISYTNITDISSYKWVRLSFDKGLTWAIRFQINTESILSFSFEINNTNLIDNLDDETFNKRYSYQLPDKTTYDLIKNNMVSIYINNGTSSSSLLAPVIYREESNNYYLDILFNDSFISINENKTCQVSVLKSSIQNSISSGNDYYSTPSALSVETDETYGQVGVLDDTHTFSLVGYKEVKKLKLRVISADPYITGNIVINAFNETFIVYISNELTWIELTPTQIYNGLVTLTRDTNNQLDTLKETIDDETNIISVKIIDWRLY